MKLEELVGKEVLIRCWRYKDGLIVKLEKDKSGIYWMEGLQSCRPEEEDLKVYTFKEIK